MSSTPIKVELPGDRLYNDDCYIQTFTLGDSEVLSIIQKTGDTKKLYELIDKRINLSVYDLTLQDLWFILHWQRINSYPNYPISLPWDCPNCTHHNINKLTGSCLNIEDLDDKYEHGLEVPYSSEKIKTRLPLVGDEVKVSKFLRKIKVNKPDAELLRQLLIACMFEPNGEDLGSRLKLVESLTADDGFLLKGFEKTFDYGVLNYTEFACESCGEVSKVRFKFDLTTFFPGNSITDDIRSRIFHSKTSPSADTELKSDGLRESPVHEESSVEELERAEGESQESEEQDSRIAKYNELNNNR